jgi:branched-chain amino acid transport system substrate-binding protein
MVRAPKIAIMLVAVGLVTTACSSSSHSSTTATTAAGAAGASGCKQKNNEIVVGEARAQTGDFAFFDVTAQRGNELAIDHFNATGGLLGCHIRVIEGDAKGDPALGGRVASDLIGQGAQILFSPSDFDIGIGSAQAGEKAGLVGTSEASAVNMPAAVGPHFFAAGITDAGVGLAEADFANSKGWQTAYEVTNEQFSLFPDIATFFKSRFTGKMTSRDVVADTQTDYSAVISKINAVSPKPDVIFLNDYFPHIGTFIKQLRDAGNNTPVLGNSSYDSLQIPDVVGKARVASVYYVAPEIWEGATIDAAVSQVLQAFRTKYGKDPDNNNFMEGYDSAFLLLTGVQKAGTLDAAAVSKAINSESNVPLPGATLTKWADNHTQRTLVVIGFDAQGNFVRVTPPADPQAGG